MMLRSQRDGSGSVWCRLEVKLCSIPGSSWVSLESHGDDFGETFFHTSSDVQEADITEKNHDPTSQKSQVGVAIWEHLGV